MSQATAGRARGCNPYSRVFTIPGSRAFSSSAALARLPMSMISLGIVLAVNQLYGDWTNAGTLSAVYVMSSAVATPVFARLFDRHGQRVVGRLALPLSILTLTALTVALLFRCPLWVLYPLAILTGLTQFSFGALVRTRWTWILRSPSAGGQPVAAGGVTAETGTADGPLSDTAAENRLLLTSAYSFESAVDELIYVIGPVFATTLATMVHPVSQLFVPLVALATGGFAFFSLRSALAPTRTFETVHTAAVAPAEAVTTGHPTPAVQARQGQAGVSATGLTGRRRSVHSLVRQVRARTALGFPGMILLILSFIVFSMSFSAYDVSLLAMTKAEGQEYIVGLVMATFAGGSMVGALVYGSRKWPGSLWARYIFCLSVLTLGFLSFFFLRSNLPVLCLAQFVSGLFVAPTFASCNMIIEDSVPGPYLTEGLSWLTTSSALGSSVGSTLAGILIDRVGLAPAFMIPWASVLAALLIVLAFRRGWWRDWSARS